ncbi:unnamed protein product [Moneuplotes crassus]|uniref:peptidyl-tRNA hydrolase n=1 Tax=Euplotes crassus TaxID=5936 RepID=A0AAD1Y1Y9_EUPCR|nr:unnamed protein product [Moneuplotes crassus]
MKINKFDTDTYSYLILGVILGIILYKFFNYITGGVDYEVHANDGPEEEVALDNLKMVLVVRTDLKMQKGKIGAQCGHATLGAYEKAKAKKAKYWKKCLYDWEVYAQAKVCLKVDSEEALVNIHKQAKKSNLPTYLVTDAGRTQIAAGSKTVVGIGPAPSELIDKITGDLKLL